MVVTLADIASRTNLSTATVSRALSGESRVSPRTRERVQRVAAELGYMPNQTARSLSSGRSEILGLMVPDIANPFFPPIIKAVQARAESLGKTVLITDTDENPDDEVARARKMRSRVDGMILVSPRTPEGRVGELAALGPVVFVNRLVDGAAAVIIDDSDGLIAAVEHLVALGHRAVCYLNGPRRSWSNRQRRDAVATACESSGATFIELGPFEAQIEAGRRAADLVLASDATAVIAYDDSIALGLMNRMYERGIRVGIDISVIGIDGSPMSGLSYPLLTSIQVPGAEAGRLAVDLLCELISTPETNAARTVTLSSRLVVRGSTDLMHPRTGGHPSGTARTPNAAAPGGGPA